MTVHNYANTASVAQLGASMDGVTTTLTVSAPTYVGWPAAPFWAIIAKGTVAAEVIEVTNVAGVTLTVARGQGGTSAAPHSNGDALHHIAPAVVFAASEAHIEATTGVHGVSGSVVGTSGSQTITDKLYRGGHKSNFTDALPAGLSASFESVADNANARDGFVHRSTSGDVDRRAVLTEQSGAPRVQVFNDGTVRISPSGAASRPALRVDANFQADAAATVAGATTLSGTLTVNGPSDFNAAVNVDGVVTPKLIDTQIPVVLDTATRLIVRTRAPADAMQVFNESGTLLAAISSGGSFNLLGGMSTITDIVSANGVRSYGSTIPMPTSVASLASITAPVDGQLAYLTTDGVLYRRVAGAWASVYRPGMYTRRVTGAAAIGTGGTWTTITWTTASEGTSAGISTPDNIVYTFTEPGIWTVTAYIGTSTSGTVVASLHEGTVADAYAVGTTRVYGVQSGGNAGSIGAVTVSADIMVPTASARSVRCSAFSASGTLRAIGLGNSSLTFNWRPL